MVFEKIIGSIFQRHLLENAAAKTKQNAADIAYVAMMCDVEMENGGEEVAEHEEVEEV